MPTANYGPRVGKGDQPIINVRVDTRGFRVPAGTRDPITGEALGGRFLKDLETSMYESNRRQAREVQAYVVSLIGAGIRRRNVSTGRLMKATADNRNIHVDPGGFHVGIESYLNRSIAKYWRTVEEGSAKTWGDTAGGRSSMVGMELKGYFGNSLIGMTIAKGGGLRALAGPPFTKPSRKVDPEGKFMPNPKTGGRGIISRDTTPQHAYRKAFHDLEVGAVAFRNFERYLFEAATNAGLPIIAPGSSTYFRAKE